MDTKQLLLDFSSLCGVSGCEDGAAGYAAELLAPCGEVARHPLGSVLCRVWQGLPDAPHLLLDAHLDEVGAIVTHIEEDGFLRVAGCGGIDRRAMQASPVTVQGKNGPVTGVFCSTPPHLAGRDEKKIQKPEEVLLDIGCDKSQAERLVAPGDRVSFRAPARPLLGDTVSGKALDDRAGCVAILHALELLKDATPACNLTVLFSAMEEVGCQGAKTAAYSVSPTHAVAVDVSFAHTPDSPKAKCGNLGEGPMVGFAPILSHDMSRTLCDIAAQDGVPFQTEVMSGKTGTNADCIATARSGVVTGLLSIPLRYMHTPVETLRVSDVENTGRLLAAYIARLGREGGGAK